MFSISKGKRSEWPKKKKKWKKSKRVDVRLYQLSCMQTFHFKCVFNCFSWRIVGWGEGGLDCTSYYVYKPSILKCVFSCFLWRIVSSLTRNMLCCCIMSSVNPVMKLPSGLWQNLCFFFSWRCEGNMITSRGFMPSLWVWCPWQNVKSQVH